MAALSVLGLTEHFSRLTAVDGLGRQEPGPTRRPEEERANGPAPPSPT
jgi:hypothetical protein